MSADILLFALIAAGLIFWLKSILGTKNEGEEDKNKKSSIFYDDGPEDYSARTRTVKEDGNVVRLKAQSEEGFGLPIHVRIDNKTTENFLSDLRISQPDFDLVHFAQGAEAAFRMIIEAFADGDLETLNSLLAPQVYAAFEQAILARKEKGETVETEIHDVEKIDICDVKIKDSHMFITVRFAARETCVVRDSNQNIISGDPDRTTVMVDVWIFGKDLDAEGPEWHLYETRDEEKESHKTPLPEAGKDDAHQ